MLRHRSILYYGAGIAAVIIILKLLEHRLFRKSISWEIYIGIIAIIFTAIGVWLGLRIVSPRAHREIIYLPAEESFVTDQSAIGQLGLSARELQVLEELAKGHSNKEIAEALFISLSTVKTHIANLFLKLDVKSRMQAVKKAREMKIIAPV